MSGKKVKKNITIPQVIRTEEDFKKLCDAMDEQHKLFCDHYMVTLNAADSYRKAGYKSIGKSAESNSIRLIRNDKVKKYIDWKLKQRKKQLAIDEKYVLNFLQSITKRRITDYYEFTPNGGMKLKDLTKLPDEKVCLIDEISETVNGLRIKLVSISTGLDKLGAHLGMWNKDKKQGGSEGTQYIIRRYIVPAQGNVMVRPKITPADMKEMVTQHIIESRK